MIARESLIKFFKQYEPFIVIILRFILGVFIFSRINTIGYARPELAAFYAKLPLTLLLGAAFAVLPSSLSFLMIIVDITVQYSANTEIAMVVFLFLLCILLFYVRMAPRESILIILTVIAYYFKIPYLIPLIAGLYFSLSAIAPVSIGVFIAAFIPVIQGLIITTHTAGLNVTEMVGTFTDVYTALLNGLVATQGWLFTAFIFAMVIVVVYVVSRLSIDFAKEIAIGLGCVLNIFGYIMAVLVGGESINLLAMLLLTVLCGVLAELARLFDPVLDYQHAESVQFEDETNYYYVRVVPKVIMTKPKRVVRRIRPQPEEDDD